MKKRRSTASTKEILEILTNAHHALSHEMIFAQVQNIDRATVYRILNRFCEDGITHRITDDNGKHFFALCKKCSSTEHSHNHLHFQCVKCNKVECFEQELSFTIPQGYTSLSFNGMVSGHCQTCS